MEDEDSNECVIIENTEEPTTSLASLTKTETRPLMLLFQRLVSNDCKQNTVLTNAQIYAILEKEYNMNINTYHPLEVSIFLNILKRYLKDWPQWEEFDNIIHRLKKINATSSIKNILEHKYKHLKDYLWLMIEAAKPLAEKAVKDLPKESKIPSKKQPDNEIKKKQQEPIDMSNITLEICCSRSQLNELIFNKPHPEHNNTIFNLPTNNQKITVQKFPVEAILNFPDVKITIDLKFITYNRYTKHEFKHVLVNSVLNVPEEKVVLSTDLQRKNSGTLSTIWNRNYIKTIMDSIAQPLSQKDRKKIVCVLNVVKSDMECMVHDIIKAPGFYRQYTNEYPYYRKLFKPVEVEEANPDYDLHIKETISPMHMFFIGKVTPFDKKVIPPNFSWIKVECTACKVSFSGSNFKEELVEHFMERHVDEPDWTCTNCNKSFTMIDLSFRKWRHVCELAN